MCPGNGELIPERKTCERLAVRFPHPAAAYRGHPLLYVAVLAMFREGFFMLQNVRSSFLSPAYWAAAAAELKRPRSLVLAGLTAALSAVLSSVYIPVGLNLRVTAAFLAVAFGSMLFGPVVGLFAGLASDLVGYVLSPGGVFFPGYTFSSMLAFFLYGLFLYRSRPTVLRILLMKLLINYGVHVGLGSLWSNILYGKGYSYFFARSLLKNTILLPLEVAALAAVFHALLPLLRRQGLLPEQDGKKLPPA